MVTTILRVAACALVTGQLAHAAAPVSGDPPRPQPAPAATASSAAAPAAPSAPPANAPTAPAGPAQAHDARPDPTGGPPIPPMPTTSMAQPVDTPGLHNVVAFAPGLLSGSVPEGDAGFDCLKSWGIRTIISVDGAVPDVERARARGIRYVHLPIGYHGFDEARKLELARAARDLPRPTYIHCHHGRHRSAGAAGAMAVTLGWLTPADAVARMRAAGTAPAYDGLYRCTSAASKVADAVLDSARADFPEASRPKGFVRGMVDIDVAWDNLKAIQAAGWTAPPGHPDLSPASEAGRAAEVFRLLRDDARVKDGPEDFRALLVQNGDEIQQLEDLLAAAPRAGRPSADLAKRLDALFAQASNTCKACHSAHRD